MAKCWAVIAAAGLACSQPGQVSAEPAYIRGHLSAKSTADTFVASITRELRRLDAADDGLDRDDVRRIERTILAGARADNLQHVMRFDLNGDLRVSAAEARQALDAARNERNQARERDALDLAWFDADADGQVSLREVRRARTDLREGDAWDLEASRALMAMPQASDGRLTEAELASHAQATFAAADKDGDGVLNRAEAEAARATDPPARAARLNCRLPPLRRKDSLVLIGVAEASGPRSLPPNRRTATVTLRIMPGNDPLYIVAASGSPVRWVLEGDVERVARVVALAEDWGRKGSAVLVEGLEAPLAQTRAADGCIPAFVDATSPDGARSVKLVTEALGRAPDTVIATVSPRTLVLR